MRAFTLVAKDTLNHSKSCIINFFLHVLQLRSEIEFVLFLSSFSENIYLLPFDAYACYKVHFIHTIILWKFTVFRIFSYKSGKLV